jgi:peptide/nickel transport system substrate-binding protein
MQTTYTLRPNLTWHDGEPLTSDDFVFGWRVAVNPDLGLPSQIPQSVIADIEAISTQSFLIRWKAPYPDADSLSKNQHEFPALPQHILASAFDQAGTTGRDAFFARPFWTQQYVGLGPYRVQQWEPGSFIDAVRFEGYALGLPKISSIQVRFSADQNVVVANLLAGTAQVATDSSISQTSATTLEQEWAQNKGGTVLYGPGSWRSTRFQLRPEIASPRAILEPRVRKALAHAIDKSAINDAVYGGKAILTDTPIFKGSEWGPALDDSIPTYSLDLRATESLLTQAGFAKGQDGFYRGPEGRLSVELATTGSPQSLQDVFVIADGLRTAGIEVQQRALSSAQQQDGQARAGFPALFTSSTSSGEAGVDTLANTQIPTAANRWQGTNLGAWSSPEYNRPLNLFKTTLDRADRIVLLRQVLRAFSEELPAISEAFPPGAVAYTADLKGPPTLKAGSVDLWNIHEWELT